MKEKIKVALVHDFLNQYGGAERVLKSLSELFPDAPIYTLLYDEEKMREVFSEKDIRPSYLQKLPRWLRKRHQWLLPFYPVVPETFDLRDYDVVISSSGAWSKGIVTKLNTRHIAYIHSPMRYIWDYNDRYLKETGRKKMGLFLRFFFNYLRIWDKLAAERPDYLIANSHYTKDRIAKYYRRDSHVIYPPVNIEHEIICNPPAGGTNNNEKGYFLTVSRLSAYKKIDIMIEAFNKLGLPLKIVGEGERLPALKKMANENISFCGWQDEDQLKELYRNARAFIFAAEDDFGIAPVEAMSFGVPVIAYGKGGSRETVQEGKAGLFFDAQTPEVLADGIRRFIEDEEQHYKKGDIIARARNFSEEKFKKSFMEFFEQNITTIPDEHHNSSLTLQ